MILFDRIAAHLQRYDQKELVRFILMGVAGITLITGWLIYSYLSLQGNLLQKYAQLNKERTATSELIAQHARLVEQRKKVDALLEKDPNFLIIPFFTSLISSLGLNSAVARDPVAHKTPDLVQGYGELQLEASLKHINMQQFVDLLSKVSDQERVYIKEVSINKANPADTFIDVTLTLATFERNSAT